MNASPEPLRLRVAHVLAIVAAALVVVFVLFLGYKVVDNRNERRTAGAVALAEAKAKVNAELDVAKAKVAANAARIELLARLAASACRGLNTDAARINAVIDYFELYAKLNSPGAATDQFFAQLPRPTAVRCTPKPRSSHP